MEHPDITAALQNGYPKANTRREDLDTPDMRAAYIREYKDELIDYLKKKHPEIVEDWMNETGYLGWLYDE